jgi:small subunit ribosomal protein S17
MQEQDNQNPGAAAEETSAAADTASVMPATDAAAATPTERRSIAYTPIHEKRDGHGRNLRRERIGVVTSNKMDKSIVVRVESRKKHPLYGKFMSHSTKFMAHDEKNDCGIGDTVRIQETRPLSASKRWRLVQVIERAK